MSKLRLLLFCCGCLSIFAVPRWSGVTAEGVPDVVEQQIRRKIFSYAVGNKTEFNQLNEKDYCRYHIFTGALTNLWLQLSIAKDINDIIHEGIKDVTANRSVNAMDVHALKETLERIQDRLKSNALLTEHYIDAKTAIETDIANIENKTCKSDVTNPSNVSQSHRFFIHQLFLDETVRSVNPRCDPEGYNRTVLALAILRVSKKPDQRPAITQLYDEAISDVVKKITYEVRDVKTDSTCPTVSYYANAISLFDALEEKINKNDILKGEIERAKVEVAPAAEEMKTRDRRNAIKYDVDVEGDM